MCGPRGYKDVDLLPCLLRINLADHASHRIDRGWRLEKWRVTGERRNKEVQLHSTSQKNKEIFHPPFAIRVIRISRKRNVKVFMGSRPSAVGNFELRFDLQNKTEVNIVTE